MDDGLAASISLFLRPYYDFKSGLKDHVRLYSQNPFVLQGLISHKALNLETHSTPKTKNAIHNQGYTEGSPFLCNLKVPITSNFLLSYLILHNTKLVFSKKFFDLHKTQFFYNFFKTFKFAAILVHHSHQSSSV